MERQTGLERYQNGWRRVGAHLIDGFALKPLSWISTWVFAHELSPFLQGGWVLLSSAFAYAYYIVLHGLFGQTIGKKLLQIRLEDVSGTKATWKQAVFRDSPGLALGLGILVQGLFHFEEMLGAYSLVYGNSRNASLDQLPKWMIIWTSFSFLWVILELITMLTNPKRRAIHDFIAGTVVVRVTRTSDSQQSPSTAAGLSP